MRGFSLILSLGLLAVGACTLHPPAPIVAARVRSIRIVPLAPRACPGAMIQASYVAVLDNDSTRVIEPDLLSAVDRSAVGAVPADDGAWATLPDALLTARTGFLLHAQLHDRPSVANEVIVAPDYTCPQSLSVRGADFTVRIAQLRSPLADSVVLIAVTIDSGTTRHFIVDVAHARRPAVQLWALGAPGRPGGSGPSGGAGPGPCSDGMDGGDGGPGFAGGDGGSFTILVEDGFQNLLGFIETHNGGGPGGPGGAGGGGGAAGGGAPPGDPPCSPPPRNGNPGHAGISGPPGANGPANRIRALPLDSLWRNSPTWSDSTTHRVLAAMLADTQRRRAP